MFKTKFLRVFLNKYEIKLLGQLSKYRNLTLQIYRDYSETLGLHFGSCSYKRLFADLVYTFEFSLDKLFKADFVISDSRVWDDHTDKAIPWEDYEKLPEKREGKPKFKFRTQGKEKWYYTSKFLKLYNFDFLNDPYGITIDFAWFPFPIFTKLQFGCHPRHRCSFIFDVDKTNCMLELAIFGCFMTFEFGKNTLDRDANLKHIEDFKRLLAIGQKSGIEELLNRQIARRNAEYVKAIVNSCDILNDTKISDECLIHASYDDAFKKEVFDVLVDNIEHFNSWDKIENDIQIFEPYAVEKLKITANEQK